MYYTWEDVVKLAEPHKDDLAWSYATLTLGPDDTAVNPASTKHPIYGPCKVTYAIHVSGTTATVEDA